MNVPTPPALSRHSGAKTKKQALYSM